jgi:hypothetical protein
MSIQSVPKPWAVLAYTVADDRGGGGSLDAAARRELKALCDAADFGQMSIAAQVDFKRPRGVFRGSLVAAPEASRGWEEVTDETHALWRQILGGVDRARSTLRVQKEEYDLSSARAHVLEEFLRFGREACPAERYVVFFYGHAYGPMGLFCDAETGQREPDTLRLNDLATSIGAGDSRAAVVVFRDCFMNTLETAYQLRQVADTMVATQALAPIAGIWPWPNLLAALMTGAETLATGRSLAMQIANFLEQPANRTPFADVPYSLLDLTVADEMAAALSALVLALESARATPKLRRACARALEAARVGDPADHARPGDPALIDVLTMCEGLMARGTGPVASPAATLAGVVRQKLVRWHHAQRDGHRGTSLYYRPVRAADLERSFLQASDEKTAQLDAAHYATLALCEATGWHRIALQPFAVD